MAEKKIRMANLLWILTFMLIIWPCGCDNLKFNNGGGLLSSAVLFKDATK